MRRTTKGATTEGRPYRSGWGFCSGRSCRSSGGRPSWWSVATVLFYPYTKHYATAYGGLQMWNEAKTDIPDFLVVHGFFLALSLIYLISELVVQLRERQAPKWLLDLLPWLAAAALILLAAGWILHVRVWIIALPMLVLAVLLALGRDVPPVRRFGLLLLALALAITMGVEVVRLKDDIGRMNTVFKFYLQAWTLFGVTAAYGLATWASRALSWRPGWRRLAWAVTAVLFIGVMLYPPFAARAKVKDRFSAEASPRGWMAWPTWIRRSTSRTTVTCAWRTTRQAMLWLMRNVQGSPVILEGQIPEYRWGSRFSIYTGLPTVQGWNWHQRQQRSVVPDAEVQRRVNQVQELYSTTDLARAQSCSTSTTFNTSSSASWSGRIIRRRAWRSSIRWWIRATLSPHTRAAQ